MYVQDLYAIGYILQIYTTLFNLTRNIHTEYHTLAPKVCYKYIQICKPWFMFGFMTDLLLIMVDYYH